MTGSVIAIVFEPGLRALITEAFQMSLEGHAIEPIYSPAMWDLYAGAFVIAVLISVLSVVRPSLRACRMTPREALVQRG